MSSPSPSQKDKKFISLKELEDLNTATFEDNIDITDLEDLLTTYKTLDLWIKDENGNEFSLLYFALYRLHGATTEAIKGIQKYLSEFPNDVDDEMIEAFYDSF